MRPTFVGPKARIWRWVNSVSLLLGGLHHRAVRDDHSGDALVLRFLFAFDKNTEVGGTESSRFSQA